MPEIRTVTYECEGVGLTGRLAVPDGDGPFAGVLIAHEGPGHDEIQLGRADRLAELGYAAFALDYHGDLAPFADRSDMVARLDGFRTAPDRMEAYGRAGLAQLLAGGNVDAERVAAIGYCFGGSMVLELGRGGADLRAIVGFHPGLPTTRPDASNHIRGKVRVFVGADDPLIPPMHRLEFEDEMRTARVDWAMHLYGGVAHSFTHPWADRAGVDGIAYDTEADRHSWQAMLDLFASELAG